MRLRFGILIIAALGASLTSTIGFTVSSPWYNLQSRVGYSASKGASTPERREAHDSKTHFSQSPTAAQITFTSAGVGSLVGLMKPFIGGKMRKQTKIARNAEPLMPWKIPNTQRWQWLSVRELLLRERIMMITEYIDESYANALLAMLLYLQSEDEKKPIQLYFAAPGAQLKPALAVYDTIEQLKARGCKVTTVSHSLCAGIAAFLVAAGTPGRRFATPNSLFRMSKTGLESQVVGQASEIEVETKQMLRESARVEEELAKITQRPLEKIQEDLQRSFYMSPEEAVEYGLVDKVLIPQSDKGVKLDQGVRDPWSGMVTKERVGFGVFADPNQPRTAV